MENLQKEYGLYINGKWQPASDGATFKTYSPATAKNWQFAPKQRAKMLTLR